MSNIPYYAIKITICLDRYLIIGNYGLQKNLSHLSVVLSYLVLGICAIIFLIELVWTGELTVEGILGSFMLAVSLAVAAIPEGLAAVVTIALSIGVTNMAKRRAIIRKLTAVETLGCAQVICSDKTGTLTQNKMTVVESYGSDELLTKAMALCCDSQLLASGEVIGDPTENALVIYALKKGFNKNELDAETPRVAEAPFDSVRKLMTTIHQTKEGLVQYTKGAPEELLKLCSKVLQDGKVVALTPEISAQIIKNNADYAHRALRVLAGAYRQWLKLPQDTSAENLEQDLIFIGLTAMNDPVRPEVKDAVDECKESGIKVVMITGDHIDTAIAIALELAIIKDDTQAMTGKEMEKLNDEELAERIKNTFVYARVQPEHKVRIVNGWKDKGYIVAMTGDGVNDAPAIKSGDIGVGMGITGTDVTKNVADMVLADDNFATIVAAVEEGRRIYDNIKKTIQFLLSSNLSEVLSIFVATLCGFVLFKPAHLLFINLITDSIPAIALGLEHAQPDIMKRPPRSSNENIFSQGMGFDLVYQGVVVTILTLAAYFIVDVWHDHETAMTAAFLTLSMCEIFHAYNMRSARQSIFTLKTRNKTLWLAMILALTLSLLLIYVPPVAQAFSLVPLTFKELIVALGLSISIIPIVEVVKLIQNAKKK